MENVFLYSPITFEKFPLILEEEISPNRFIYRLFGLSSIVNRIRVKKYLIGQKESYHLAGCYCNWVLIRFLGLQGTPRIRTAAGYYEDKEAQKIPQVYYYEVKARLRGSLGITYWIYFYSETPLSDLDFYDYLEHIEKIERRLSPERYIDRKGQVRVQEYKHISEVLK